MKHRELEALLAGDVLSVAENLLGWTLESTIGGTVTAVTVTETEAYAGGDDPASHAYRGRTARNRAMFEQAGTLYVYRSYGIHWCMNVVVGGEGLAHAVLLRGGDIVRGRAAIERRRGRGDNLTNGPGKLCQALGVTDDQDGTSVFEGLVRLIPGILPLDSTVLATPRIGISKAVDRPWRFVAMTQR